MIANSLTTRTQLWNNLIDSGGKDLNRDCGYPDTITPQNYSNFYEREGIASRVVEVWPKESWAQSPLIYENEDLDQKTPFELAWDEIAEKLHPIALMKRADILSGIGRFGIILIGIDDGRELFEPVETVDETGKGKGKDTQKESRRNLLYLRPFQEAVVQIDTIEQDISSPRFGLPLMYSITFNDGKSAFAKRVHWHRVIHLADRREMSDVYGIPRMQKSYNRLLDARKILGGSGEMFWKGGFPGYSFEVNSGMDGAEVDTRSLRTEMESYMTGLQRYLALEGVTAKSLAPQVADPKSHLDCQLTAIALAEGIPQRILFGSERGELASSQDARAWQGRLKERQEGYLTPFVIRPFVDRLIALGVLPMPKDGYIVFWPDLGTQTAQEKAEVVRTWADAMARYVAGDVAQVVPIDSFLSLFGNMSQDEINSITESLRDSIKMEEEFGKELNSKTKKEPASEEERISEENSNQGDNV
ncbi:MAG: DUF1073 domain-containing protein [Verrucomicrobiae bacterium]|nr:DUF1073 domain-containing protein [Verrucomicrobiae bacterium]